MPEDPETAWLELAHPGGSRRFPLRGGEPCRIGRGESSTIVLADDLVSRNHAVVQFIDPASFVVIDLGSINGTAVEGRRINVPTVLKNGDRITIGRGDLRFHQPVHQPVEPEWINPELGATNVLYTESLISVLVIDIRDYTGLGQNIDADTLSQVVGTFFREAGKLLLGAGAWAQKYIGDAVMAVWIHADPAADLLAITRALLQVVEIAAGLQDRFGLSSPVRIGAGLNSGLASLGNVGSIAASDYTAVGDVVNKAFRLESATRQAGCDLLIGEETRRLLPPESEFANRLREVTIQLKGYEQAAIAWGTDFKAEE